MNPTSAKKPDKESAVEHRTRTAVLEAAPSDPGGATEWLGRVLDASTNALPDSFTLHVRTEEPALLHFSLGAPDWDAAERRYTLTSPSTVSLGDDREPLHLPADAVTFSGYWLNVRGLRGRRLDTLERALREARQQHADALLATTLCELHRVVRLRLAVGEDAIRAGGHHADVTQLQLKLASLLT